MTDALHLTLALPQGKLFDEKIKSITAFSAEGEFVMLPDHCHLMAALLPSRLIVEYLDGTKVVCAADSGFLEGGVDHVNVILKRCVRIDSLDPVATAGALAAVEAQLSTAAENKAGERETLEQNRLWFQLQLDLLKIKH